MLYSPHPVSEYVVDGRGPGRLFGGHPAYWNLAWLMLDDIKHRPCYKDYNPELVELDILKHTWVDLLHAAESECPKQVLKVLTATDVSRQLLFQNYDLTKWDRLLGRVEAAYNRLNNISNVIHVDFRRK